MKFFVDTGDLTEIEALSQTGLIDGVTTNPSLIAKSGANMATLIAEICKLTDGPVSAEVVASDAAGMIVEGRKLAKIAKNVCVKVPLTREGLVACKTLSNEEISVNVTLCFSAGQALLAAKAGASFISPFVGRLDDIGQDGIDLIGQIVEIYNNYSDFDTQVLVASVRNPSHIVDAALIGADVVTVPPKVIWSLFEHPLTDKGLAAFLEDWKSTGQSLL